MRALFALVILVPLGVALLTIAACGEDFKDCYAQDLVSCSCPGGAVGYAKCGPSGDFKSSTCVCDGATPGIDAGHDAAPIVDAAPVNEAGVCLRSDAGDAGDASALKGYFDDCTTNEECASCRCEIFSMRGRCTTPCTTVAECAPPSDTCTIHGVCRPPQ